MAIIVTGDAVREVFISTAEQQGGRYQTFERRIELSPGFGQSDLVDALIDLPRPSGARLGCAIGVGSRVVVAQQPVSTTILSQDGVSGTAVEFVCGDYYSIYRLPLSAGRWLRPDPATSPYEIVANRQAAQALGGPGTTIWLTSASTSTAFPAQMVGVVNDGASTARLFTNALPWLANAPQLVCPDSLTLLWQQPDVSTEDVRYSTNDWLFDHRLPSGSDPVETDTVSSYRNVIEVMQWSFVGVAALSLVVAALGIINVGLASVRERSHELVIRRAIGASKSSIAALIIGSSLLLSIMVATVSALAAWGALIVFRNSLADDSPVQPPGYPWTAAMLGTSVSILTALIGSIIPGVVAARLQPGMALRE